MNPYLKGMIIGGASTFSALTLGYFACKNFVRKGRKACTQHNASITSLNTQESLEENKSDEGYCVLLGDIGGTNVRYWLCDIYLSD
jgi:hypothetical protein